MISCSCCSHRRRCLQVLIPASCSSCKVQLTRGSLPLMLLCEQQNKSGTIIPRSSQMPFAMKKGWWLTYQVSGSKGKMVKLPGGAPWRWKTKASRGGLLASFSISPSCANTFLLLISSSRVTLSLPLPLSLSLTHFRSATITHCGPDG